MKESKAMMRKEVAFMKKKGAPKSMIRHEEEEMGGGKGKVKKFAGRAGSLVLPSDRSSGFRGMPGTGAGDRLSSNISSMSPAKRSALGDFGKNAAIYAAGLASGRFRPLATAAKAIKGAALGKQAYDIATMDDIPEANMSPMPETLPVGNRKGGKINSRMKPPKKHRYAGGGVTYSGGGSVYRSKADGIASKGKTKGKIVKMRYGGEC